MRALCLITAAISLVAPARAEFVLVSPPTSADSHADTPQALSTKLHSKLHRSAPDPPLAGFGADIPLSFAIRQIVPPLHAMLLKDEGATSKALRFVYK